MSLLLIVGVFGQLSPSPGTRASFSLPSLSLIADPSTGGCLFYVQSDASRAKVSAVVRIGRTRSGCPNFESNRSRNKGSEGPGGHQPLPVAFDPNLKRKPALAWRGYCQGRSQGQAGCKLPEKLKSPAGAPRYGSAVPPQGLPLIMSAGRQGAAGRRAPPLAGRTARIYG